jgi:hypothetical protein
MSASYYLFNENAGIQVEGSLKAEGTNSGHTVFDKTNSSSSWAGITVNSGFAFFKYCDVKNSVTGIVLNYPEIESKIIRCSFTNNLINDVSIYGFEQPDILLLVDSNTFNGNENKTASFKCYSGTNLIAKDNNFNNEYGIGMDFSDITNSFIKRCNFTAVTLQGFNPIAINLNNTGGFINCCNITNFSTGIRFSVSSPTLFNNGGVGNGIYNNGYGLYLTGDSNPVLAPYLDPGGNQINGGVNKIHDNSIADIYCENNERLPQSLPAMENGNNLIYGNSPYFIVTNLALGGEQVSAAYNWWGGGEPPTSKFYPEGSVNFNPVLENEPTSSSCDPQSLSSDNENIIEPVIIPKEYKLYQNYPNPFNPFTHIKYDIPKDGNVKITVYNVLGEEIKILTDEFKKPGKYDIVFDGINLASGIYFFKIEVNNFVAIKKGVLLK